MPDYHYSVYQSYDGSVKLVRTEVEVKRRTVRTAHRGASSAMGNLSQIPRSQWHPTAAAAIHAHLTEAEAKCQKLEKHLSELREEMQATFALEQSEFEED